MTQTLVFLRSPQNRQYLTVEARRSGGRVRVFEATTQANLRDEWNRLVEVAHEEPSTVLVSSIDDSLPGGAWSWLVELARLSSIPGTILRSLKEPSITLDDSQGALLVLLKAARQSEVRKRTLDGVTRARRAGHGPGRPRVQVDVAAMATFRLDHSLRATAKEFGVGTSTCHRILAAHAETQRSGL